MRANDPIIDFNQDIKQFQETPWSEVAADLTDQIIADMKVLTRAFTRQINIAELLTKDAEAFLAKLAVRHVLEKNPLTPPRNQPHGPVRKGHGGKARRW